MCVFSSARSLYFYYSMLLCGFAVFSLSFFFCVSSSAERKATVCQSAFSCCNPGQRVFLKFWVLGAQDGGCVRVSVYLSLVQLLYTFQSLCATLAHTLTSQITLVTFSLLLLLLLLSCYAYFRILMYWINSLKHRHPVDSIIFHAT